MEVSILAQDVVQRFANTDKSVTGHIDDSSTDLLSMYVCVRLSMKLATPNHNPSGITAWKPALVQENLADAGVKPTSQWMVQCVARLSGVSSSPKLTSKKR